LIKDLLRRISILMILIPLLVSAGPGTAQAAHLTDMVVTNTRDNLLLFVKIEGAFTEKMKQAILNGIPTTFSYIVNVTRVRRLFPDQKVVSNKLTHTIKYDNLRKLFVVRRSWEDNRPMTTESMEEAERWMSEIESLPVVSLSQLKKGGRYKVNAKTELDKITLPFRLNYLFFFVSLWDFETEWHSVDFVY